MEVHNKKQEGRVSFRKNRITNLYFDVQRVSAASITTIIKMMALGALLAQGFFIGKALGKPLNNFVDTSNLQYESLLISILIFSLILVYGFIRKTNKLIKQVLVSTRIDLLIALVFGAAASCTFEELCSNRYSRVISHFTLEQIFLFVSAPGITALLILMRPIYRRAESEVTPFFVADTEKRTIDQDLLNISNKAEVFADRVYNNGSTDSIVFGLDAPWGIGKSSFINFCQEFWNKKYKNKIIVYKFNPLRYEDDKNLIDKFIDGLVKTIQQHVFIPEIRPLASKYSRYITAKGTVSIPGIETEIFPSTYTIDDAFEDLERALERLGRKIIVVVDDLDRLNFSSIKSVLFAVKKSFTLPNINYVICYDTENIAALEDDVEDTEKIVEFLEKFINVKIGIYLGSQALTNYVQENLARSLEGNSQANPELIQKAIGGLIDIFNSLDYHYYLPYVGDIRKLKRLINTILLLDLEKTDFDNSDFDKNDLIHLLLIYINYPSVFRKIHDAETNGKQGFFSLVGPFDPNYPESNANRETEAKNSTLYTQYIETLDRYPKFILEQLFNPAIRFNNTKIANVSEEAKRSYACFNQNLVGSRNLEDYINLIVNLSKPQQVSQYRFYVNAKNQIKDGKPIAEVLSAEEFSSKETEENHERLWRVIVNSAHEFNADAGMQAIQHLKAAIPNYSLISNKNAGLGLRDDLPKFLVRLLDATGWLDSGKRNRNNSEENVQAIADWIFGEGKHLNDGVLQSLISVERGVLGLFDTLVFRLACSADRGSNVFNLSRALSLRGDPNAPTQGNVRFIAIAEMREISQEIFRIFSRQYIDKATNIFESINQLTLAELAGDWYTYLNDKITNGSVSKEDVEASINYEKARLKAFISYQLGNSLVENGVGCGGYDEIGNADNAGIRSKFGDYLLEVCFDPNSGTYGFKHFVEYLLLNYQSPFFSEDLPSPSAEDFTKVLDRKKLVKYWEKNSDAIKAGQFTQEDKFVIVSERYNVSYKELERAYDLLDKLLIEEAFSTWS